MPAFTELEVAASSLSDRPLHVIHGRIYDLNPYFNGILANRHHRLCGPRRHSVLLADRARGRRPGPMQRCQIGTLGERLDRHGGLFESRRVPAGNIMPPRGKRGQQERDPRPETTKEQRAHFMHAHMQFRHEHLPAILAVWGDGTRRWN